MLLMETRGGFWQVSAQRNARSHRSGALEEQHQRADGSRIGRFSCVGRNRRVYAHQHVCSGSNPFGVRTRNAQETDEYVNTQDGFKIYFPSQPMVKDITWWSQQDFRLPGRVYSVDKARSTTSHSRRLQRDRADGNRACQDLSGWSAALQGHPLSGPGLWKHDVREAPEYATFKLIQRDNVKVSDLTWSQHDMSKQRAAAHQHGRRGAHYAYVGMHEMKLYIAEATCRKGSAPATFIPDFVHMVDKDGKGIALPDHVQQRVPRDAAVSRAAAQHRCRSSVINPSPRPRIGPRHKRDGNHANNYGAGARIARTSRRRTVFRMPCGTPSGATTSSRPDRQLPPVQQTVPSPSTTW